MAGSRLAGPGSGRWARHAQNQSRDSRNGLRVSDFMRTLRSDPDSQQPTAAARPGHSVRRQAGFSGPLSLAKEAPP